MKGNNAAEQTNGHRIGLVSAHVGLSTTVLSKLITSELGHDCHVVNPTQQGPAEFDLVLIDCQQDNPEVINEWLQERLFGNAVAALMNAQHEGRHERLLEWPAVKGIFYVDADEKQLISGLRQLLDNGYWLPRRLLESYLERHRKPVTSRITADLTRREFQILSCLRDGATNQQIAEKLAVSEHTIKSHLYNIYKKLNVRNRLEASNWARSYIAD